MDFHDVGLMSSMEGIARRAGAILALTASLIGTGLASSQAQARHVTTGVARYGHKLLTIAPSGSGRAYLRVLAAVGSSHKPSYQLVGPGTIAVPLTTEHGNGAISFKASKHGWTHIAFACEHGKSITVMRAGRTVFEFSPCDGRGVWQNTFPAKAFESGTWTVKTSAKTWEIAAITDGIRKNG